jgi:myo-inositol 2-dehydrogenase/D-chiro-inositol 1-dehydrogenase
VSEQTPTSLDNVTRRVFVRSGAALGTAALVTPSMGWAQGSDKIKVGLIGCGGRGTGAAGQSMTADPGTELWAMGDAFPDRLASSHGALSKAHGDKINVSSDRQFTGFDAFKKVIDSGVDVVILTTPPHFRPEHFAYAIKQGKHCFVEKPMAIDGPGVRSVLETAKSAKAKDLNVMGGFCWRYNTPNRECYARLNDGAIGDVMAVHSTYCSGPLGKKPRKDNWSDMEWQLRNWQHMDWLGGDHIAEQACHAIDKIAWAMNGKVPERAITMAGRQMRSGLESGNIYDHFSVMYEYADGARGFHDCRQMPGCWNDNTEYMMGTKGNCIVNSWGPTQIIEGPNAWEYDGPNPNMYQVEHNELMEAIRGKRARIDDTEQMMNSTLMAIMGRMSGYSGRPVTWNDALNSTERMGPTTYQMAANLPLMHVPMPGKPVSWNDWRKALAQA